MYLFQAVYSFVRGMIFVYVLSVDRTYPLLRSCVGISRPALMRSLRSRYPIF